ncbi:Solute carrier organic anion transporter member 5A1 [Cichlidogyrus casuarinus]|uniref:Solute carrier organic anion transporter member 5A1 n=1 Tax=Cichlidogyrus casuarinus TaxID=1844966 RepID=A0ABD2Q088_9PLAT
MENTEVVVEKNSRQCGIGLCRLTACQKFADIRIFLAVMCVAGGIQAAFAGYSASLNTTLEKRFSIGSFLIGTINACFEIGYIIAAINVTHFAAKAHVPRCLSFGFLIISFGAFLVAFLHFIMPSTEPTSMLSNYSSNTKYIVFLYLGQFCIGVGSSPILTLAPTFIDSHVHSSKSPPMIAALYSTSALGPVFGFALGTVALNLHENLIDNHSGLKPHDARWIGAWWFGYFFLGAFLTICAFIMFSFPLRLRTETG